MSNVTAQSGRRRLRGRLSAVVVTVVAISAITAMDHIMAPTVNLSALYLVPITYAAWTLGRLPAYACAAIADVPHYIDQSLLTTGGVQTVGTAVANVVVWLLVYLFAAEVTVRLVESRAEARSAARQLVAANEDLQRTYARLDEDVNAAGLLQASMLSPEPLTFLGCQVGVEVRYAGKTGGDFADAGTVDGRVYVCVADVSGKGTPAALFTTLLKYLLSDAIRRGARGRGVVGQMNAALCQVLPSDKFVTLFYAEIDPPTGSVEYVNAGHTDGLIYRANTGALETASATTGILGICDDSEDTPSARLRLQAGDVLAVYSDGAVESRGIDGNRLGDEPIRRLVVRHAHMSAQEMAERIAAEIEAATIADGRDDLAILCVKVAGEPEHADARRLLEQRLQP